MNVLAVGAHPDDLEILCAGTLLRYARAGHNVVMCNVAIGDKGTNDLSPEEIAAVRLEESRRAAEIGGARHLTLGIRDTDVDATDSGQRLLAVELLRSVRPDVVLTHHPADYMGDHRQVSALVFDTTMTATLPRLETASPALEHVPSVYYMDTLAGVDFLPEEYVDVSDTLETKLQMLAAHASQVEWLRHDIESSIVEDVRTMARFRGMQAGVRFAEGFVRASAWHRGTTRRLLP